MTDNPIPQTYDAALAALRGSARMVRALLAELRQVRSDLKTARAEITGLKEALQRTQPVQPQRTFPGRLSERQRLILAYIVEQRRVTGVTPTLRAMMAALDISSTSVIAYNLEVLRRRGLLHSIGDGKSRAWVPTDEVRMYRSE